MVRGDMRACSSIQMVDGWLTRTMDFTYTTVRTGLLYRVAVLRTRRRESRLQWSYPASQAGDPTGFIRDHAASGGTGF
jgi:hypothetical protein